MLLKIDDPKVAHEYWQAGLLYNPEGLLWAEYNDQFSAHRSIEQMKLWVHRAYIFIED